MCNIMNMGNCMESKQRDVGKSKAELIFYNG